MRQQPSVLAARRGSHATHPTPTGALCPLRLLVGIVGGHPCAPATAVTACFDTRITLLEAVPGGLDELLQLLPRRFVRLETVVRILHHAVQGLKHRLCRLMPSAKCLNDVVDVLVPAVPAGTRLDNEALILLVHLPNDEILVDCLYDQVLEFSRGGDVQGHLQVGELDVLILARKGHDCQQLELPLLGHAQGRQLAAPRLVLRVCAIGEYPEQL
mmetsp:Transcript_88108/g.189139  ORF Transcript_88108/g.189139 Transcript_88108/m.189139 type:complete len:214 (+) Transcript_88108:97-738(+)